MLTWEMQSPVAHWQEKHRKELRDKLQETNQRWINTFGYPIYDANTGEIAMQASIAEGGFRFFRPYLMALMKKPKLDYMRNSINYGFELRDGKYVQTALTAEEIKEARDELNQMGIDWLRDPDFTTSYPYETIDHPAYHSPAYAEYVKHYLDTTLPESRKPVPWDY